MRNWAKFLLPLAIVLTAVLIGQKILQSAPLSSSANSYRQAVKGIEINHIKQMVIKDQAGQLEIKKVGDHWQLEALPLDEDKIQQILTILLPTDSIYELVSQNPSKFAQLGVASPAATISIRTETEAKTFRVGQVSDNGNFIQVDGGNRVYLTQGVISSLLSSDPQSFWQKKVLDLSTSDLTEIEVRHGLEVYQLTKAKDLWQLENSRTPLNLDKVSRWLTQLDNLQGQKIIRDQREKANYAVRRGGLTLKSKDKTETLDFDEGKVETLVSRSSDGLSLTINTNLLKDLLPQTTDLVEQNSAK